MSVSGERSNSTRSARAKDARRCRAATCGSQNSPPAKPWRCAAWDAAVQWFSSGSCAGSGGGHRWKGSRRLSGLWGLQSRAAWAGWRPPGRCCCRMVVSAAKGCRPADRSGLTSRCIANAVSAMAKNSLAVDFVAGAHAQLAQNAAVQVQPDVGMAGVHRAHGRLHVIVHAGHAQPIGGGLQQAVAAFSQPGQKWLPSTNSICVRRRRRASSSGVRFSTTRPALAGWCRQRPGGHRCGRCTGGKAALAHGGIPAQMGDGMACTLGSVHQRIAFDERHGGAVKQEVVHPCCSRWAWASCVRSRALRAPVQRPGRSPG